MIAKKRRRVHGKSRLDIQLLEINRGASPKGCISTTRRNYYVLERTHGHASRLELYRVSRHGLDSQCR